MNDIMADINDIMNDIALSHYISKAGHRAAVPKIRKRMTETLTSLVWKHTASRQALAMCDLFVNCVRPQIVLQENHRIRRSCITGRERLIRTRLIRSST